MKRALFFLLLGLPCSLSAAFFECRDTVVQGRDLAYKVYIPDSPDPVRGAIVLAPGYNGDGRGMAGEKEWQALAVRTRFALIGCLTRDTGASNKYWEDPRTPDSLLRALKELAVTSGHPELENAPLAFWGISAGGIYGHFFSFRKPERTIAFVVNKSVALDTEVSTKNRDIPGLWIAGETDTESRMKSVTGLFGEGRRQGALWSLVIELQKSHEVARSKALGICFLEDAINLRVSPEGKLNAADPQTGWLGDAVNHEIQPVTVGFPSGTVTSWLPGKKSAEFWQAVAKGLPDPSWWLEMNPAPDPKPVNRSPDPDLG